MPHILISTPEQQAQRFLTLQLVFAGYSVAETENLEQTLEMLWTTISPFDLLLLDVCNLVWYGPVVLQALEHAAAEGLRGIIPTILIFSPRSSKEHWLDLLPATSQALDLFPPEQLVQEIEFTLSTPRKHDVALAGERPKVLDERTAVTAARVSAGAARKELTMPRVLLVEDEVPFRRILTMNLVHCGYTVIEADTAATAKDALCAFEFQFDLLLLDINLPDQTGWDVLRFLEAFRSSERQRGNILPNPPVIILTAVRPAPSRLGEFHPKAVLIKPFPIEALLRLIERVCAHARSSWAEELAPPEDVAESGPLSGLGFWFSTI